MISSVINPKLIVVVSFRLIRLISLFFFPFQPEIISTLFNATTKGTFLFFSMSILSIVCGSNPLFTSATTIAISAADPPLLLRLANTSCPGVSINNNPGICSSVLASRSYKGPVIVLIVSIGKKLAPIC